MSAFTIRAEGGACAADLVEVRRALSILVSPGERHELRALPSARRRTITGSDIEAAIQTAYSLSDEQVYYSLNPIFDDADGANAKTVKHRKWFLIDVDPIRPKDSSATEEEKELAGQLANEILGHLIERDWPEPLMIDSGNGWHLIYRIDLPNSPLARQVLKGAIHALADRFDNEHAKVDRAVHDAPRISKLPGTWARKGPNAPDRPHRPACITYQPNSFSVVTVEQLQGLGESKPHDPSINGTGFKTTASDGPGKASYVKSAILGECGRIALAIPGNRNNALNHASFSLGTMADWPEMTEFAAKAALIQTARQAGLDERETLLTVNSGWNAGKGMPRPRPVDSFVNANAVILDRLTIGADEVTPEVVVWLWENVLALGFINLFAGRTGVGKSFVLCDVASKLSRGLPFADGSPARPINGTLFISEDPYQFVLVPRIIELGGNRSKIGFMRWKAMAEYQLSNTDLLQKAWEERSQPELIVIDPPANFLGGKDEHRNSEVRSVLMKLVEWLDGKPVAIALITHYNKGGAQKALDALDRIMGSVAWSSSARVACGFVADPAEPNQCIFGGIKNNLGPKASPLSYRIVKTDVLARVEWLGKSDTTLDDAMAQTSNKKVDCAQYLVNRFRDRLEWDSADLIRGAQVAGISERTLRAVKSAMNVGSEDIRDIKGRIVGHRWQVPPDWKWFREKFLQPGRPCSVDSHNYQDNNNIGESVQAANPHCNQAEIQAVQAAPDDHTANVSTETFKTILREL